MLKANERSNNAACQEYEALLEDRLSGVLGGADARKLAAHLASCAGCRAALDDAQAGARLLKAAALASEGLPDPGFAHRVMARINVHEQAAERAGFWLPFVPLAWRFAAGAALAVALLLAYPATWRSPAPAPMNVPVNANVASLDQSQVHDIFSPDPTRIPADPNEVLIMVAESNHGTD